MSVDKIEFPYHRKKEIIQLHVNCLGVKQLLHYFIYEFVCNFTL